MTPRRSTVPFAAVAWFVLLAGGSPLLAQQSRPGRGLPPAQSPPATAPTSTTPGQPNQSSPAPEAAAPERRGEPTPGPYIQTTNPRDLLLNVRVSINSDSPTQKTTYRDPFTGKTADMPVVTPFKFQSLAVVWPIIPGSASSEQSPRLIAGDLRLNDRVVSQRLEILDGYPGGTMLARLDAGDGAQDTTCRQVELRLEIPMRVYRTRFDEPGALRVPWPTGEWPAAAASLARPQLYLETGVDAEGHIRQYDDARVAQAVELWLKEQSITKPRGVPPVALAKILAAGVWRTVQIHGEGLSKKNRTGETSGILLQTPAETLESARGSEHDLTVLLAAVMRKAGLPARVVIGWEAGSGDAKFLRKSSTSSQLRSWVEFCLFDEERNTINWVPVDIARLRKSTSRPQALTQKWKYFGDHDELDGITPFAFHFHPPTDVVSYGWPGFWGWFVTPEPPKSAEQALQFTATLAPKRATDRAKDQEREQEKPRTPSRGY